MPVNQSSLNRESPCIATKEMVMNQRRQLTRLFCSTAAVFAAIVQAMCAVDGVRAQTVSSDLYEVLAGHEDLTNILTGQPREQKYYSGWPPHLVATRTVGGTQTLRYDSYNLIVTIPKAAGRSQSLVRFESK